MTKQREMENEIDFLRTENVSAADPPAVTRVTAFETHFVAQ